MDADHFVASAKCFANDFYFQCVAIWTSKKVAGERRKAAKEANRAQRMETEFQVNEQSIKDIVARELQKEFSKRHPAVTVSKQFSGKSTISRGQRKSSRSSSRNGNPSKTGRGAKAATPQKRRSRSRTRKSQAPRKQSVTFSDSHPQSVRRRHQPKNGKSPANGPVK